MLIGFPKKWSRAAILHRATDYEGSAERIQSKVRQIIVDRELTSGEGVDEIDLLVPK